MKAEFSVGSLDQMWGTFAAKVMPPGAPLVQMIEMENTFKAGLMCMLKAMTGPLVEQPDEIMANTIAEWFTEYNEFLSVRLAHFQNKTGPYARL